MFCIVHHVLNDLLGGGGSSSSAAINGVPSSLPAVSSSTGGDLLDFSPAPGANANTTNGAAQNMFAGLQLPPQQQLPTYGQPMGLTNNMNTSSPANPNAGGRAAHLDVLARGSPSLLNNSPGLAQPQPGPGNMAGLGRMGQQQQPNLMMGGMMGQQQQPNNMMMGGMMGQQQQPNMMMGGMQNNMMMGGGMGGMQNNFMMGNGAAAAPSLNMGTPKITGLPAKPAGTTSLGNSGGGSAFGFVNKKEDPKKSDAKALEEKMFKDFHL